MTSAANLASARPAQRVSVHYRKPGQMLGTLVGACLLAVCMGLIALSASPILVALAATLVIAPILVSRPTWSIWVVLVGGMLIAGVLPIWAEGQVSKVVWALSALCFLLMVVVLIRAFTTPGMTSGTPGFVWMALAFMAYAIVDGLLQWSTPYEVASGVKRYFQAFGLLFALSWLPLKEDDFRRWRMFFFFVALIQLPWAIYERIRLVPLRAGFQALYPGLVPIDVVAGTFGANMREGGANAEMATFLIFVLAFLLARNRERLLKGTRLLWLGPLVIAPLFLGETKVVVILLPLMFIVLFRREVLRHPHVAFAGIVGGLLLTAAAVVAYVQITKSASIEALVADTVRYNFKEKGFGKNVLNRTTVLTFWARKQGIDNPVSPLFGNGLGSSHDATGGHVSLRYPGYGIGLTAAPTLLWDLGVVGFVMFMSIIVLAWRAAARLIRESGNAVVRADASAIQATLPLFAVYVGYRIALLELLSFQIVFAVLLGYLAWLYRRHKIDSARNPR